MQAINISHDEAIQALNRSKGDVSSAFESELETFKINMKELNNLVLEYAAYRYFSNCIYMSKILNCYLEIFYNYLNLIVKMVI